MGIFQFHVYLKLKQSNVIKFKLNTSLPNLQGLSRPLKRSHWLDEVKDIIKREAPQLNVRNPLNGDPYLNRVALYFITQKNHTDANKKKYVWYLFLRIFLLSGSGSPKEYTSDDLKGTGYIVIQSFFTAFLRSTIHIVPC